MNFIMLNPSLPWSVDNSWSTSSDCNSYGISDVAIYDDLIIDLDSDQYLDSTPPSPVDLGPGCSVDLSEDLCDKVPFNK